MKQVLIRKGKAVVTETPAPVVQPGHLLVRVSYSLISTGTEMSGVQRSGQSVIKKAVADPEKIKKVFQLIREQGLTDTLDRVRSKTDAETATGYSCSGVVVDAGDGVDGIVIGDRVACAGAGKANHAEYVSVPKNLTVKVPQGCSLRDASSVTLGAIALQGVRRADVKLGESAAVIGLGLIGQLTVQLLKASGCRVVGIDIDPARIRLALSLGMDHGFEPGKEDASVFVRNITSGHGVDAAIITADSKDSGIIQQAMEITRKKGSVVIVGSVGMELQRNPFYKKEIDLRISCSYGPGRYDDLYEDKGADYPFPYVRWTENRNMQAYLALIAGKTIDFSKLAEGEYPIDRAGEAFESLKKSDSRPLAVLLVYDGEETGVKKDIQPVVRLSDKAAEGKIRVGVIGCGSFAVGMHLPNLKRLKDDYSIHALSGRDGAKVQSIGRRFDAVYTTTDYQKILADPEIDMVMICTRHNLHARIAVESMRAGKAVFVEKPLATTEKDFLEIRKYLEDNMDTARLMVGFNRRFSPAASRAKEVLSNRTNPAIIIYRVNAGYAPPGAWVHTEEGGGRIIGEACHMLDLFRYLTGGPPESVDVSSISPSTGHISNIDNIAATVKYSDGSLCTLIYSSLGNNEVEKESIEILCDNRVLKIHDFLSLEVMGSGDDGWKAGSPDKGHLNELIEFGRYLRGTHNIPIPVDELIETTGLSFLINRMAKGERPGD